MIPVFLIALILFTGVLALKRQKSTQAQEAVNRAFWERERQADSTRRQDISHLDYLPFSADALPMGNSDDEILASCEAVLTDLSGKRLIDLSSYSNTDLKLMYGPANLTILGQYDDDYHTLASTLLDYAKRMQQLNHTQDAISVLEYAMSLSIDSSQIYLLLAELYRDAGMPEKISDIEQALASMNASLQKLVLPKLSASHTDE